MRPEKDQIGTLKFIAIAVVLMLLMDHFVFDGKRSYIEALKTEKTTELPPPVRVQPPDGKEYFEAPVTKVQPLPQAEPPAATAPVPVPPETVEKDKAPDTPLVTKDDKKSSYKAFVPHGAPKIAIVIDDIGMDVRRSRQALELPAPVTMAFLPYAPKTRELAVEAKVKGHPLIIHTPMEAEDGHLNIGPGGLKEGMSREEFGAAFGKMMASFDGYDGINNHMGSRLTQDSAAMAQLMGILKQKKLFFLDSKTSAKSVAGQKAHDAGVPFAARDVFIDHVDTADAVRAALNYTAELAQRRGYAIAIGHPKDHTLAGLRAWIPTLKAKGIELVPVKSLLSHPEIRKEDVPPVAAAPVVVAPEVAPAVIAPPVSSPAPPIEMFPPQNATGVTVTTEPSAPSTPAPEIQLHPLPQQ